MRDYRIPRCLPHVAFDLSHTLRAHDIRRMHTTHWPRLTRRSRCPAAANNVRRNDATTYNEQRITWPSVRTRRHSGSFPPCTPMSSNACNDVKYPLLEWSGELHCCVPQAACCMLHVACCMLHDACCMLHVACCGAPRTGRSNGRLYGRGQSPHARETSPGCLQEHRTVLQRGAACCNVVQPVATQCSLLQRSAACCNAVHRVVYHVPPATGPPASAQTQRVLATVFPPGFHNTAAHTPCR
jgi:hypothetical protein